MRNILLLGGTGAMGSYLIAILKRNNYNIYVTSRKYRKSEPGVIYLKGDAHNLNFLLDVLQVKFDIIVDFMVYTTAEFKLRISTLLNSCLHYVFLSSARVYSVDDNLLSETSKRLLDINTDIKFLQTDDYSLAKAKQENLLINCGNVNWTIIRPYITYFEGRLQLGNLEMEHWLFRALQGKKIVFSSSLASKRTTLTYGLDVANGIYSVIENSCSLGQIYNIMSPESITWKEVLEIYSIVLKKRGYRGDFVITHKADELFSFIDKYKFLYDRNSNRIFDVSKVNNLIDTKQFISPTVGLEKCLNIFLDNPSFSKISWSREALLDRISGDWSNLNKIRPFSSKIKYMLIRIGLFQVYLYACRILKQRCF